MRIRPILAAAALALITLTCPSCITPQGLAFSYDASPMGIPATVAYSDGKAVVAVRVIPAK